MGMGLKVAAINRSGAPREKEEWMNGVDYIAADVFEPEVLSLSLARSLLLSLPPFLPSFLSY